VSSESPLYVALLGNPGVGEGDPSVSSESLPHVVDCSLGDRLWRSFEACDAN